MSIMTYQQKHTDIAKLYKDHDYWINKMTTVCGWIQFYRSSGGKGKNIGFVKLKDGSCFQKLQIIFSEKDLSDDKKDYFNELYSKAKIGVSLQITGLIVKSPAKGQPIEMIAHEYTIFGDIMDAHSYPISKNELSLEFLRTIPHLRTRTDTCSGIMRIKSVLRLALAEYFDMLGFYEVQIPCITDNECESGANAFKVTTILNDDLLKDKKIDYSKDFFKGSRYLTVSGQLHLEACVLGSLCKAWCMTTAFRAEPSLSPLHLAEFMMAELEFCFCTLEDNIKVNEGCVKYCLKKILEKCGDELEFFQSKYKPGLIEKLQRYVDNPFVVTTHEECVKQMLFDIESGKVTINPDKKAGDDIHVFKEIPKYDDDFSKDHEKYITGVLYGNLPVFACHYPSKVKAFYMPKINKGDEVERCDNFDLLFPEIGEVVGGSQRETNYDELISRMKEMEIRPETLEFYSDLRKYGTVPHGGSGIGIDRLMLVITGMDNIREMVPFPRSCGVGYF